jgi:hypothetical protein
VGKAIGLKSLAEDKSIENHLRSAFVGMASDIANAATRSVLGGTDFGDNLIAALPDVLGQTIGNMIAYGVSSGAQTSKFTSDQSYLASGDTSAPSLSDLTKLYGAQKANAIMAMFNSGTATQVDGKGELILTPALAAYLAAHTPDAAAVSAEEARLLDLARTKSLKAYYDFGYSDQDAAKRYDTSMTSIGDDRRAATLTLEHQKLDVTDANIALLTDRVFGGNHDVVFPKDKASEFKHAVHDLEEFSRYRSEFISGLARSSLAVNALLGFANTSSASPAFRQASIDMRAAIDSGYFTLRPHMSISNPSFRAYMQQYNAGAHSEIIIYKEGFSLDNHLFARGLFHELMHAQSLQESLFALESGSSKPMLGTVYDPDPKTYYDRANAKLVSGFNIPGVSPAHAPPVPPAKGGGGITGTIADNYEKGHMYEGNVNNWYSKVVLKALKLY